MEGLGGELRRWRAARGLTLVEAARRAGVVRLTLSRWESGESPPNPKGLVRLLDALAVAPEERTRVLAEAAPRGGRDALAHERIGSPVHLGQALRALRVQARLTQTRLAQGLGTTQATVARWETGARVPDGEALDRLLAVLGAKEDDAAWARSLIEREPLRFGSPLDAKDWLEQNRPWEWAPGEARLLAFERAAWLRAARDDRWLPVLAGAMGWRAVAHGYAGDRGAQDEAVRGALALAAPIGAWDAAIGAIVSHLGSSPASAREEDRRRAAAFGRLRDDHARLLCLHEWATRPELARQGRSEELLDRMWGLVTQETTRWAQDIAAADVWCVAAEIRWQQGDPEGALKALARVKGHQRTLNQEVLSTMARHLVEPKRPTEAIVRQAYAAALTEVERTRWRWVARELGLPPPR